MRKVRAEDAQRRVSEIEEEARRKGACRVGSGNGQRGLTLRAESRLVSAPEASRLRGWYRSTVPDDARSGLLEFAVLSALFLFWEILLIRWISTESRLRVLQEPLALRLLPRFRHRPPHVAVPGGWRNAVVGGFGFLVALVVIYPVSLLRIDHAPAFFEMFTWHQQAGTIGTTFKFYGVILLVFLATAWAFVPWGRRIGYWFEVLRPIPAYSLNVSANLVGIGLFSLLAVLRTPPLVWVLVGIVPLVLLAGREALRERSLVSLALIPVALTLGQQLTEKAEITGRPTTRSRSRRPTPRRIRPVHEPQGQPRLPPAASICVRRSGHAAAVLREWASLRSAVPGREGGGWAASS
jgi:hypothetical protein